MNPDPLGHIGHWFKGRRVYACEHCNEPFGETTGEIDGKLVCAECVVIDRERRGRR